MIYQVLDSIKVFFNGLIAVWTGVSVGLQTSHQVRLEVCVNLHIRQESYSICISKACGNTFEKICCRGCPSAKYQLLIIMNLITV